MAAPRSTIPQDAPRPANLDPALIALVEALARRQARRDYAAAQKDPATKA